MREVVCVNFAVVKGGILLFLYLQTIKEKCDKIKGEKIVTTIIHKSQLLVKLLAIQVKNQTELSTPIQYASDRIKRIDTNKVIISLYFISSDQFDL